MELEDKQKNRTRFRNMAFGLAVATMVAGAGLALSGIETASTFGSIAIGVMTFCGIVFGADYFSDVSKD